MKDKDLMSDTGGKFKTKDLQRPSRSDRKKTVHDGDRDFDDVSKDRDLKAGGLKRVVHLARVIEAFAEGRVVMTYEFNPNGRTFLIKADWSALENIDGNPDALIDAYDMASAKMLGTKKALKENFGIDGNSGTPGNASIYMNFILGDADRIEVEKFLKRQGFIVK